MTTTILAPAPLPSWARIKPLLGGNLQVILISPSTQVPYVAEGFFDVKVNQYRLTIDQEETPFWLFRLNATEVDGF